MTYFSTYTPRQRRIIALAFVSGGFVVAANVSIRVKQAQGEQRALCEAVATESSKDTGGLKKQKVGQKGACVKERYFSCMLFSKLQDNCYPVLKVRSHQGPFNSSLSGQVNQLSSSSRRYFLKVTPPHLPIPL